MTTPQPNPTDNLEAVALEDYVRKVGGIIYWRMFPPSSRHGGKHFPAHEPQKAARDAAQEIVTKGFAALPPAGVGEAVGYVQRSVAQGHYDDHATIFNDCSESHDCPLYAHPAHPDAALMERVRTVMEGLMDCMFEAAQLGTWEPDKVDAARSLLSDLKAEAGT